jgi:hypothetical protein
MAVVGAGAAGELPINRHKEKHGIKKINKNAAEHVNVCK